MISFIADSKENLSISENDVPLEYVQSAMFFISDKGLPCVTITAICGEARIKFICVSENKYKGQIITASSQSFEDDDGNHSIYFSLQNEDGEPIEDIVACRIFVSVDTPQIMGELITEDEYKQILEQLKQGEEKEDVQEG